MTSRILHVSGDFPDVIAPFKTPVIKGLLELTSGAFDHEVVSINRVSPGVLSFASSILSKSSVVQNQRPFEHGTALEYLAPGRGLFHRTMLDRLGEHLASLVSAQDPPVDLIVGHKLTIEGIAVAKAANLTGLPYALTIQGNTDRRILKARPDLKRLFRQIYEGAQMVCTFTPIARNAIERALGKRSDGIHLIPCPTELDKVVKPKVAGGDVISVFHLKNHEVKNLRGLAEAASLIQGPEGDRSITIIGGGNEAETAHCKKLTAQSKQFRFAGPVTRDKMQQTMNDACVLVVPSKAESFGLVFVEALFAGLPIIYPKGTAIDGYFEGLPFAQGVDASSPSAIAEAIKKAIRGESEMKHALSQWQQSPAAEVFTRSSIAQRYEKALENALIRPALS